MMNDFDNAILQATLASFTNEISEIQLLVNRMEMDLLRRCEGRSKKIDAHPELIKNCRKSQQKFDQILKDLKNSFIDVKLCSVYELFESIFRVSVYFNKTLAEAYFYRFKEPAQSKTMALSQNQYCSCMTKKKAKKLDMQRIDYELSMMEKQELLLLEEMENLTKNLSMDKEKLDMISCEQKNGAFKDLQVTFNEISLKTQRVINSFFQTNQSESKIFAGLENGAVLYKQIQDQMKKKVGQFFPICLKKMMLWLISQIKLRKVNRNTKKCKSVHIKEEEQKISNSQTKAVQRKTRRSLFNKDEIQESNIQEQLVQQIKKLKSQIQGKEKQIGKLKKNYEETSRNIKINQNQYHELEKMFKKRSYELEECKSEINLMNRLNSNLKAREIKDSIIYTKNRNQNTKKQKIDKSIQVTQEEEPFPVDRILHRNKGYQRKKGGQKKSSRSQQKKDDNFQVYDLVSQMNQFLKLKSEKQQQSLEDLMSKWKKAIEGKAKQKKHHKSKLIQRNSKNSKNRNSSLKNSHRPQIQNNPAYTSIATQTVTIKPLAMHQRLRSQENRGNIQVQQVNERLYQAKTDEKILSQRNFVKQNLVETIASVNSRTSMNSPLKKRVVNENSFLRYSSNMQKIQQIPQVQRPPLLFEDLKLLPNDKNKTDKAMVFEGYVKQKAKKQDLNKNQNKEKWKDVFERKKKMEKQRNERESILVNLENLDFTIWAAKFEQFLRFSKQTDPKKYERLICDILTELSHKIDHQLVETAYHKYLKSSGNFS